jgi:endo-1,4-beta-D-glucanase Y
MSLITNNLSLVHPDKFSSPLHIDIPHREINSSTLLCSIPEVLYNDFTKYDKFCNDYVKEKQELKLPDIKVHVHVHVQDNYQPLFYKRTEFKKNEQLLEVKKVTPLKVGQMAKYGQMLFEYKGGF